jgi:hypothetical protein
LCWYSDVDAEVERAQAQFREYLDTRFAFTENARHKAYCIRERLITFYVCHVSRRDALVGAHCTILPSIGSCERFSVVALGEEPAANVSLALPT